MRWFGLMVWVVACRGDEADADGDGDPFADTAARTVWVDADGNVVSNVVSISEGLAYVDGDGLFWRVDPFGSDEGAFSGLKDQLLELQFSDPECEVPLLPRPPAPRMPIFVLDDYRVVPDDGEPVYLDPVYASGADCRNDGDSPYPAIPVAEMLVVERPTVTWTPPLHPELR